MTRADLIQLLDAVPWRANVAESSEDYIGALADVVLAAWEQEQAEMEQAVADDERKMIALERRADAAEARVEIEDLNRKMAEEERDQLAARVKELEAERDELRHLLEIGASQGAAISPVVRRVFAAGSQAARERDLAEAARIDAVAHFHGMQARALDAETRFRDLEAKLEGDMSVREASLLEELEQVAHLLDAERRAVEALELSFDDIASKLLTDLEVSGIHIQPPERWLEVKAAIKFALTTAHQRDR